MLVARNEDHASCAGFLKNPDTASILFILFLTAATPEGPILSKSTMYEVWYPDEYKTRLCNVCVAVGTKGLSALDDGIRCWFQALRLEQLTYVVLCPG